jgi:hypothetical protein
VSCGVQRDGFDATAVHHDSITRVVKKTFIDTRILPLLRAGRSANFQPDRRRDDGVSISL